jgi:hypothetical protein
MCVWLWQAWYKAQLVRNVRKSGTKYQKKMLPITAFKLITGGALQKIGEFDNQAEASAAAGISGNSAQKNGVTVYTAVCNQLMRPTKFPSNQGHRDCLFFRGILGCAITDVDIKAKLDLRGTAAAKKELKNWRRSQAGACS